MGRRKPIVPDWQLPWTPDQHGSGEPITLRKIITRVVLKEVEAFKDRQQERRLVRILTERQIEDGLNKGRVDSGGRELHQMVNPDKAVAMALQAFEDGIYLVIFDGEEQRDLDDDPRTAEVMSKVLLLARDREIKDPNILDQIRSR
jgi:hypothetical protein